MIDVFRISNKSILVIPVSQVIPVIPASQVIPVIPVSQVIPVIPVSPVRLAHLWVDLWVICNDIYTISTKGSIAVLSLFWL